MVAHGIAVEKHGLLARQAQGAREHWARITEQQGKIIAALIRAFMESCGLPVGTPGVGAVIRALLEQCRDGEPSPLSPAEAEAARSEIREQIGSELRAHAAQLEEGDGQRALSAPNDDRDARDSPRAEEMMGARRVIGTPPERRQPRSQSRMNGSNDVEVDGQVVDKPEAWGAAEAAGRNAPDGGVRPLPEHDQAERAKADPERQGQRDRQPQTSPIGDLYGDPSRWRHR